MKRIFWWFLVFIVYMISISCTHAPVQVKDPYPTSELITIEGETEKSIPVQVKIETTEYLPNNPYNGAHWWGTAYSIPRKHTITNIEVIYGNNPVHIPMSAYSDLADSDKYSLTFKKNGFSITIKGADAGGSYVAILTFDTATYSYKEAFIISRKVYCSEFKEEVYEETFYHWIYDDGTR